MAAGDLAIHRPAEQICNPKPFLTDLVGKLVVVKLKWGMEYKGEPRRLRVRRVPANSLVSTTCAAHCFPHCFLQARSFQWTHT